MKAYTLPERGTIPDSAEHILKGQDGTVLAKYCRHCGRFTRGTSAHYTSEHKGRYKFPFSGPAAAPPAPAPAPAPADGATGPSAGGNMGLILPRGLPPGLEVPVVDNADTVFHHVDTDYDFGSMPSAQLGTADTGAPACEQSHAKPPCTQISDPEGLLASLVKDYGGH